jgi:hypothetical protein
LILPITRGKLFLSCPLPVASYFDPAHFLRQVILSCSLPVASNFDSAHYLWQVILMLPITDYL